MFYISRRLVSYLEQKHHACFMNITSPIDRYGVESLESKRGGIHTVDHIIVRRSLHPIAVGRVREHDRRYKAAMSDAVMSRPASIVEYTVD
jgi:hypothetical protein